MNQPRSVRSPLGRVTSIERSRVLPLLFPAKPRRPSRLDVRRVAKLVDHVGKSAPETGQDILAIERVFRTEPADVGQRLVDGRRAALRIDHPDQRHSSLEVLANSVQDVPRAVGRRQDLDGQVGSQITESFRDLLVGKTMALYVNSVARACDRVEYLLSGRDEL